MTAQTSRFGTTSGGETIEAIRLQGGEMTAVVLTRGGILQDLRLAGTPYSLALGSDALAAYEGPMRHSGGIVGPVANRIAGAEAVIDGRLCHFPANEGPNLLHGGAAGTDQRPWRIEALEAARLTLALDLPDGDSGFPGARRIHADYLLEGTSLTLTLTATTDAPTLMSLAHHGYWNLDGSADYAGHRLRVAADRYLATDAALLFTGEAPPVAGITDLRDGRVLDLTEGYDLNFCLADAPRPLTFAAELTGRRGLTMTVETTAPGLQVFDGRTSASAPYPGHSGQPYGAFAGLALEAQPWPGAAHHPRFPPITLAPGEIYRQVTRYGFRRY